MSESAATGRPIIWARAAIGLGRFQVPHLYPILPLALYAIVVTGPLRDNSFLWHVRAGAMQLASVRVLTQDPFSYAAGGEPWRTQSWIAELLYGFMESAFGGVTWAVSMVAIVGVGALSVVGLVIYKRARSTVTVAVWLFVLGWLLVPFGTPRPVLFSYLLLAGVLLAVTLGDRAHWAVVPLVWFWAGVHGSWIIGIGLVMLVAIGRRSLRVAAVGAIAVVFTAATAHGIGTWVIVATFARNSSALELMGEWGPPDFGGIVQAPYLIVVAGLLIAAVRGRVKMADLWVVVPFLLFGLTSERAVPISALVLVPYAATSIRLSLPERDRGFHAIPWLLLVLVMAVTVVVHIVTPFSFDRDRFPSDQAVAAAGTGRFFHDDAVGGYLIYREGPERLVYVDDRVELYGVERFGEFLAARDGDYEAAFERFGFSAALVRPEWPLSRDLLRDGWHVTYRDPYFEVLVPRDG